MQKCTHCGKDYAEHKGLILVDSATGNIRYLCSSKCRKNSVMKRKKKKWSTEKKPAK